ncbi:MAG: c-type cytochrome [Acidimicrobiia bacterium]
MSELSAAAAAALGVPEAIVERSAAARATESGMSVDEVLAAWAGGGSVAASTPAEAAPAPAPSGDETPPAPATEQGEAPVPPPAPAETPAPVEEPGEAAAAAVARSPIPAEVTAAQAANLPEVVTVPTAGIRERMNLAIPRWLAAAILIIPAFALFALGGSATDTCGDSTELQTDVVTGEIVNCDGSEFTGSGVGGGGSDFIAMGESIFLAAPGNCQGCHGATGGGGAGPPLGGVTTTFGACADHIEWVTLGSQGFLDAGESTYGDSNKTINRGMPAFGSNLSEEQLASVVAFERVRFSGADPAQTLTDCGLAPAEGEEGAPGEESPGEEAPAGEDTATSTTESGAGTTVAPTG